MKTVTYKQPDGTSVEVQYDETALCTLCGLPVVSASMGGTHICPWCDCGSYRDGEKWTFKDAVDLEYRKKRAQEKQEAIKHVAN